MKKRIYGALAMLVLASCNKNEDITVADNSNYPSDGVVRISTTVNDLKTRGATPYTGSTLSVSLNYGVGDEYTQSNIEWTSQDNGTTWEPGRQMLWKNATTAAKVYAFAPFVEGDDLTAVPFTVQQDQSAGIESSDLLGYVNNRFIPGSSLTTKNELNIDLSHKLSKLTLNLTFGGQYETVPTVKSISINSVQPTVGYNAVTGVATASGSTTTIKMHSLSATGYEVIFPAQTISASTKMLTVVLSNGDAYNYTVPASGHTFADGAAYTMNLKVGKEKLELKDVTVTGWGTGDEIPGGEAVFDADEWDGTNTAPTKGSGSKVDPYLIETAEHLAFLSTAASSYSPYRIAHFKMTKNLDLKYRDWTPIGAATVNGQIVSQNIFQGYVDGAGYTIYGLKVTATDVLTDAGLFGRIAPDKDTKSAVVIQDLNIKDAKIYAGTPSSNEYQTAGILVGQISAMNITNSEGKTIGRVSPSVVNCHVSGTIEQTQTQQNPCQVGGLCGQGVSAVVFDNCSADVAINTPLAFLVGGFVGYIVRSTITNCYVKGSVNGAWTVGGFAGETGKGDLVEDMVVENCSADVAMAVINWNIGGFVGYNSASIRNCTALSNITTALRWQNNTYKMGGFVGTNEGVISSSTYKGTMTFVDEAQYYGGFVGYDLNGTTSDCRFDGTKNPSLNANGLSSKNEFIGTNDIKNSLE